MALHSQKLPLAYTDCAEIGQSTVKQWTPCASEVRRTDGCGWAECEAHVRPPPLPPKLVLSHIPSTVQSTRIVAQGNKLERSASLQPPLASDMQVCPSLVLLARHRLPAIAQRFVATCRESVAHTRRPSYIRKRGSGVTARDTVVEAKTEEVVRGQDARRVSARLCRGLPRRVLSTNCDRVVWTKRLHSVRHVLCAEYFLATNTSQLLVRYTKNRRTRCATE